jgi:hypothetical protein
LRGRQSRSAAPFDSLNVTAEAELPAHKQGLVALTFFPNFNGGLIGLNIKYLVDTHRSSKKSLTPR